MVGGREEGTDGSDEPSDTAVRANETQLSRIMGAIHARVKTS